MKIYTILCTLFFSFCVVIRVYKPEYSTREIVEIMVFSGFAIAGWMILIFTWNK